MTSIVKLQVFSGAYDESPPCYLLQVDEFRFLLDCGWNEDFNMTYIRELKRHAHLIDAVLLTYPDHNHLGALPYMVGKCGLTCPVYATIPVYKMGQMFMYDLYQSRHNNEEFNIFTLDDIDAAFDKITQLKYSQTVNLKGKGQGLQITPLPAGHMIGGTIWKIVKDGDEEEIVYAVDYNHKKERHLNGCVLESINRPSLLITDSLNSTYTQSRRRLRDEQLMTTILSTMRNNGNVLVAVDTSGRVLELAQLLDQMWRSPDSGLSTYSLALLNNVSFNVVEFAKSQVEWMSDKIMRAFEDHRNNPFHFKHLKLCHNLAELSKVMEPKVVLASMPDLQCGFARDLFMGWCGNAKNSIILTCRTSIGTLARWLIDHPKDKTVTVEMRRRVKLEGSELEEYLKKKQEKEAEERLKTKQAKREAEDMESSDDSDLEMEVEGSSNITKAKHDLMMKSDRNSRSGFFKQAKKAYPMFPFYEERLKWDECGEIIRTEDYMILDLPPADEEVTQEKSVPEDEAMQDMSEVPTKCVSSTITLEIHANVKYIDFEGRSDGESIRKIITQIKPRQLILIHGRPDPTESLEEFCLSSGCLSQTRIFAPHVGDIVDATRESHIYQVKLKDYVVSALTFSRARDAELAWIEGQLDLKEAKTDTSARYEPEETEPAAEELEKKKLMDLFKREDNVDAEKEEEEAHIHVPTLEALPSNKQPGHTPVFINEPKLSDLKMFFLQAGIQAEFTAGVLICNNKVAIRKNEAGKLQLEGALCPDYFVIRDLVYQQYAIV
ncbi:cleavage and polyadenylation specificity factor subunit 2 [Octopus bimaculoides]|uniref:Cleavage and polyadenylation specificity factor subunit 2 n=1 Tax=Octopus bimaculoides TaxID=37653 RepID=A0A0L8HXL4_OCTBM|nr:cleavage and polyadenylation specificity factor subunit 2 [Octopus bimaculoides]|eukprot:XP_014768570.1 PREDICTED: cleavage and polyadenylation specificity factor subunit 2-like [Octopus bimaculoides]